MSDTRRYFCWICSYPGCNFVSHMVKKPCIKHLDYPLTWNYYYMPFDNIVDENLFKGDPYCDECLVGLAGVWDYIIPIRLGGEMVQENKQALCFDCYFIKSFDDLVRIKNKKFGVGKKNILSKRRKNKPIPETDEIEFYKVK